MSKIRVLIADDHPLVRSGIRSIITRKQEWEVCPDATTGREALELAQKHQPNVLLLDLHLPELNGIDAARQIRKLVPTCEIVLLTGTDSDDLIRSAFEAGARSFLLKTDGPEHIEAAILALADHKPYFTPRVAEVLFSKLFAGKHTSSEEEDSTSRVSSREREVLQLLAEGLTNKEVASRLGVSVKTIETHRSAIMSKLKLESFSDLVRYAVRNHIIEA